MNTAEKVIAKFGSQSALAKLIGKGQSTVQHWAKVGLIPSKWQRQLLELAKEKGIVLNASDFTSTEIATIQPHIPIARWPGSIHLSEKDELPCYVLDDGRRVISRTGATTLLTGGTGGGALEHYLTTQAIKPYIPEDLQGRMIEFVIEQVTNKTVRGLLAEDFLTICKAFVKARDIPRIALTGKQRDIATQASMFLMACAKVGLIALIDEATGYQYEREPDALQQKLHKYLEEETREWEKTFPDELWMEFGRLTNWHGSVQSRPKYWGKLVIELIYEYLEPEVIDWLKINKPPPRQGVAWHQYYSQNYGLRKLIQHIWMVIGVSKTCFTMYELREKMALQYGKEPVQLTFFVPPPRLVLN